MAIQVGRPKDWGYVTRDTCTVVALIQGVIVIVFAVDDADADADADDEAVVVVVVWVAVGGIPVKADMKDVNMFNSVVVDEGVDVDVVDGVARCVCC